MLYSKIQFSTILLITQIFMAHSLCASELDNASLWLPKFYESHFSSLKSAASTIKETEKCHRLLSGKLLEGKSNPDHLVFTFRCRTIERYSFSVEFDNNTQQIIDPYDPFARIEEEERLRVEEQLRLLKEQARLLKEQALLLKEQERLQKEQERLQKELDKKQQEEANCQKAMNKRIDEFKAPKIIKDSLSGPIAKDNMIIYGLFFDSKSSKNKTLFYKVECKILADNDYQLKVKPRAKAMASEIKLK
jgi:ABC-type phosphate transport system auxiliary subunit